MQFVTFRAISGCQLVTAYSYFYPIRGKFFLFDLFWSFENEQLDLLNFF